MNNLGYPCINMQLSYPTQWGDQPRGTERITTNRSMIKRTYQAKGVKYASELSLLNVQDLERIIDWNEANDIKFYRMSSDVFPWASEHGIESLPDYDQICKILKRCGDKATKYGQTHYNAPWSFQQTNLPQGAGCSQYYQGP